MKHTIPVVYFLSLLRLGEAQQDLLEVKTHLGYVLGHYNEAGVREWKGLKYGNGPVGDLRWTQSTDPPSFFDQGAYEANFDAPG